MRKKHFRLCSILCLFAFFALASLHTKAQQLTMRDFVLFGANKTQIGTSTTINGGRIGSYALVTSVGNTTITANINSDNLVQLSNSNTVSGNISAKNKAAVSGTIFSTGSNFNFTNTNGRIDVGGNVVIQSGTVSGKLYMPPTATFSGPKNVKPLSNPQFPTLPVLPAANTFPTVGSETINTTRSIDPNKSYGSLSLDGSKTVTFAGTGIYTFKNIKIQNQDNRLILDFQGSTSGFIVIQVHEDADLDKINVQLANGGDASRVFTEVHGNGSTLANGTDSWRIANGSSGSAGGIWYGGVWATNGGIFVGQGSTPSKVEGSLWSATNVSLASGVSVKYVALANAVANAGLDKSIVCPATETTIGTNQSAGVGFRWTTLVDGVETVVGTQPIISVSSPGTYKLTSVDITGNTVSDEVVVQYVSCVEPINPNTGKVDNVIGHELTYIKDDLEEAKKHLIILDNGQSVLIEAVAVLGKETEAEAFLKGLGLTDEIPNGLNYQVISGKFPIDNLLKINDRPDIINHCRPVFLPVGNNGLTTSEGDKAIAADLSRNGFNIKGDGIKIGVISDSYNKRVGGQTTAEQDIDNDDLPGPDKLGKNSNQVPVEVLKDYPYGPASDEGRAMLQIVHDLAPMAPLSFRTGFLSAGDLALGIIEMKNKGCKVIVDDVTFITEPFFQDGVVSRAVDEVNNAGVAYFTSAGNFGQKAFTSQFNRAPAPAGLGLYAHKFANGSIYKPLKLKSGTYTIVLQWKDNIYSLAQQAGTQNDLDVYLVDQGGRIGFNRNNLNGDPFEVLSFSINLPDPNQEINANLLITKANQSLQADDPLLKLVIFRGNAVLEEYSGEQTLLDKSTIVGHANANGALAVGAVLFSNTEPYGRKPSTASFSSSGGTPVFVDGAVTPVVRNKPEIVAPNGVNTTVQMGPDLDFVQDPVNGTPDGFYNFYGTSAAAPHAAAAAALIMQARQKFYAQSITSQQLRPYLFNFATPMETTDGTVGNWNYKAGKGLISPFNAIKSFANPTPQIEELIPESGKEIGKEQFTLQVKGSFFSQNSVVYLRDQPLTTTLTNNLLQTTIQPFEGNPSIRVYTPPMGSEKLDGGFSKSLTFFDTKKLLVTIKADDKTSRFGEKLPVNTATIFVEGDSLNVYNQKHGTNLTLAGLGLTPEMIQYTYSNPNLTPYTGRGLYTIVPSRLPDPNSAVEQGRLEFYDYQTQDGKLTIDKLPVIVTPENFTVDYGGPLNSQVRFQYTFPPSANLDDEAKLKQIIQAEHALNVDNSVLGVMNSTGGTGVVFFQNQMLSVYSNAVIVYLNKVYPILSGTDGSAVVIINGEEHKVVNGFQTGGAAVILNGIEYPVKNSGSAVVILNGEIVPVITKSDGSAVVILNGIEYPVKTSTTTGSAAVILNGIEYPIISGGGGAVIILNGQYYPVVTKSDGSAIVILNGTEFPVKTSSTGGAAVIINGVEYPVKNSSASAITILNGKLYEVQSTNTGSAAVILNGEVQTTTAPYLKGAGGSAAVILNGKIEPVFNQLSPNGGAVIILNGQTLSVTVKSDGSAVVILNGLEYPVKTSSTTGGAAVILNGSEYPVYSGAGGAVIILNGELASVTTKSNGSAVVILNGSEYAAVNSVSSSTLANMSTSATLNAIANARASGSQTNKFVDIAANAFVQFNSNSASSTMLNTYAAVNRTLVDANRLANNLPVVVNTQITATTILNGSGAYLNSTTLSSSAVKTPVVFDQADLNSAENGIATVSVEGMNMISGISSGEQYLIPATLYSSNFEVSYNVGVVTIQPKPLTLKANNLTKEVGEVVAINPVGFTITSGSTQYREKLSLANLSSNGAAANAALGTYPITINNAIGSYGTDIGNYAIGYVNGTLSVVNSCPTTTHSRDNSFVSSPTSPVSLWLNISIKVRGQLAAAGDSLVFKSGKLSLENITYEKSGETINIPRGVVVATPGLTSPVSYYDNTRGVFITKIPVGFNSTADIFISGALVNSKSGFTKNKNPGSVLSGTFQSNVTYNGQWNYAMGAYTAPTVNDYVQYSQLQTPDAIVAMSTSSYKAGTPKPWISRITYGGTGNGGTNYTGSPTNNDNFTACVVVPSSALRLMITSTDVKMQEVELASDKALLVFPNPANTSTTVSFVPAVSGQVKLRMYTSNGIEVRNLYQGFAEAKKLYTKTIETQQLAKGVYLVQLILDNMVINRKLVVAR